MNIHKNRTKFGGLLKELRHRGKFTLRELQQLTGITYSMISAIEGGNLVVTADVAARLADGLKLTGVELEQFSLLAAGTRKDHLTACARELEPEIVNYLPAVLARSGMDMERIKKCQLRSDLSFIQDRDGLVKKFDEAVNTIKGRIHTSSVNTRDFLVVNSNGKQMVCAVVMVEMN